MSSVDPGLHYPIDLNSLPHKWRVGYVGDAIPDIQPGFASGVHNQAGEGIPHLRPMNVDRQGRLDLSVVKYVVNSNGPRLRRGDVLFNNTNSPELIGKTTTIETDEELAFSNHMTRLRPPENVYGRFVAHQLHFVWMSGYFKHRCVKHVNQASIASSTLAKSIPLILPPFEEQQQIVAEIEKQFTRLEAGVAGVRRVQANLKRYRAAVLKAACEGKLVPTEAELARQKGRPYETAVQLLDRILAERRRKWNGKGKYKEPENPDTTNLPTLPRGWSVASIDQLSCHITSGSRDWSQFYGKGRGTFILAQNIRPMRLELSERQSVAAPVGDPETERTRVAVNDLLVTIVGAKTGDVCRVPFELMDHYVCQSVALLRPALASCSRFAELYLASPENGQAQWKRYIYGQGRPHLSFEQLRMTAILLPPYAEQQRIVAEVERRLSVVEELEAVVNANLQRAIRLRQSILQRAFEGTLLRTEKEESSINDESLPLAAEPAGHYGQHR